MKPNKSQNPQKIIKILEALYPDTKTALHHSNPFELLVATILSAQCTDKRVNQITISLFQKYRGPRDFVAVPQEELERDIHSTGFFRNKAKNIQAASALILSDFDGQVPCSMKDLIRLPGVGRKTANVVLTHAFNKIEGICVDTHVARLSQRLGFTKSRDPLVIEKELMALFPQEQWPLVTQSLIHHGRQVCKARRPLCESCLLGPYCPSLMGEK